MAKIDSHLEVGIIDNEFLGISPGSEADRVVLTQTRNLVQLLYTREMNRKDVQITASRQRLSHKVVFDFTSEKYVGAYGAGTRNSKGQLRLWEDSDTKASKKTELKLPRPLSDIISFDNKHTILVYNDGTCESLQNLQNRKPGSDNWPAIVDSETQKIINIACFYTLDDSVMLTYFSKHQKTGEVQFVYVLLDDKSLTPIPDTQCKVVIDRKDLLKAKLAAFTVVGSFESCLSVMTIWSDKRIFMLPLRCNENGPIKTDRTDFEFVEMFNCLSVDKELTVITLSTNYVAIYGANTKQHGASLVLYNTRHHIVQMAQNYKVHLDDCRLWCVSNRIFMAVGRQLYIVRYKISPEKLCNIIGSKRSIEWNEHVIQDRINEESELEDYVTFNPDAMTNSNDYVSNRNESMMNNEHQDDHQDDRTPSVVFEMFERNLKSLYTFDIAIDIVRDDSAFDLMKLKSAVHPNDRPFTCKQIALFEESLVNCGESETEITKYLIPLLINANLPDELAICLVKYTNVSEAMLVKCLNYFIDMEESDQKVAYINKIFACSFCERLIKTQLQDNLQLDKVIYLLELIYQHLADGDVLLDESPQYGQDFDSDKALIKWFTAILDAHSVQFVLPGDRTIIEKILKWKTFIDSEISDVREMSSIITQLTSMVEKTWTPNDVTGSNRYSIQELAF